MKSRREAEPATSSGQHLPGLLGSNQSDILGFASRKALWAFTCSSLRSEQPVATPPTQQRRKFFPARSKAKGYGRKLPPPRICLPVGHGHSTSGTAKFAPDHASRDQSCRGCSSSEGEKGLSQKLFRKRMAQPLLNCVCGEIACFYT